MSSRSADSKTPESTPPDTGASAEGVLPDAPKREASPTDRLRGHLVPRGWNPWYVMLAFWMLFLVGQSWYESTQVAAIPYSTFLEYQQAGRVSDLVVGSDQITGRIVAPGQPERFRTVRIDPKLADRLAKHGLEFSGAVENTWPSRALAWVLPIAFILAIWMFLQRRLGQAGGLGGGLMSVGKSKAKIYAEEDVKVSFEDVAGVDEAKEELTGC